MDFIRYGKINKNITDKLKNTLIKEHTNFLKEKNEKNKYKNQQENSDSENSNSENDTNFQENNNNIISIKKKKNLNGENEEPKKKAAQNQIKRPIICICNNLYAKVLVNMRKEALIFNIKKANPEKLFNRLKEICAKESLSNSIDSKALKNLCEKSNFDIRVCINTLEFISFNKNNSSLLRTIISPDSTSAINTFNILGQKDLNDGLFKTWLKLFTANIEGFSYNTILDNYFQNDSEISIINDGIFINYLKVPNREQDFKQRAKLLNYLSHDDTIDSYIRKTFNYEMITYRGIPGAYAKKKYSTNDRMNLEFTTSLIDLKRKKKENNQILKSVKNSYQEENNAIKLSKKNMVLDIFPFLNLLIQPEFREINIELMNKKELMQVYYALNVMHTFGIKFSNIQNNYIIEEDEKEEIQIFEPNLKKILDFEFVESGNKISKKQKFIMKNEFDRFSTLKETSKIINGLKNLNFSGEMMNKIKSSSGCNLDLENFEDIGIEKGRTSFKFGNKRSLTQMYEQGNKFIYRFNEGVTNSVRRALNVSYFYKGN